MAKQDYKVNFERLRQTRSEVEHIQKLMEKSKKVLLKQFNEWCVRACVRACMTCGWTV